MMNEITGLSIEDIKEECEQEGWEVPEDFVLHKADHIFKVCKNWLDDTYKHIFKNYEVSTYATEDKEVCIDFSFKEKGGGAVFICQPDRQIYVCCVKKGMENKFKLYPYDRWYKAFYFAIDFFEEKKVMKNKLLEKIINFKNDVRKMIERVRGKSNLPIDCAAFRAFKAKKSQNTKEIMNIRSRYFVDYEWNGDCWRYWYSDGSCLTELKGRNFKKYIIQPYYNDIPQLRFVRKLRDD